MESPKQNKPQINQTTTTKDSVNCRVVPHTNYCRERSMAGSYLLVFSKIGFFP